MDDNNIKLANFNILHSFMSLLLIYKFIGLFFISNHLF